MKAIYTECSIALNGCDPVIGKHRIVIRVADHGAGPYLVIHGVNDALDTDETKHDFFLCTEEEVDKFADICKAMLRQADLAGGSDDVKLEGMR